HRGSTGPGRGGRRKPHPHARGRGAPGRPHAAVRRAAGGRLRRGCCAAGTRRCHGPGARASDGGAVMTHPSLIVACDLDSTLIHGGAPPTAEVLVAVRDLVASPHIRFVLATSRSPRCVRGWFAPFLT